MDEEIRANVSIIDSVLSSFNVKAKVANVTKGPVVTCYELALARGMSSIDVIKKFRRYRDGIRYYKG